MTADPGLAWRKPGKTYGDLTDAQVAAEIAEHGHEHPHEQEPREAEEAMWHTSG